MERNDDTLHPSQRQQTDQRGTPMRLAAVHPHSNLHTEHMEHMEHTRSSLRRQRSSSSHMQVPVAFSVTLPPPCLDSEHSKDILPPPAA
ncbi:hypothetical protein SPBR_08027 [Sporothrix brasiliensis 5110]|uniref:Uncharacterized protein n=1 Tax=Sporothrix brasiliensis 5110 TaxID=1398154 RepID=A0A0C2IG23_9PEZI|nr:uncharacterized protein SPBR_08027 [Sporothrix brasiliensis 5110]KIH88126.1 hypothetical protein SPBR_08027 [Sporothrix brasiliensis 5110]